MELQHLSHVTPAVTRGRWQSPAPACCHAVSEEERGLARRRQVSSCCESGEPSTTGKSSEWSLSPPPPAWAAPHPGGPTRLGLCSGGDAVCIWGSTAVPPLYSGTALAGCLGAEGDAGAGRTVSAGTRPPHSPLDPPSPLTRVGLAFRRLCIRIRPQTSPSAQGQRPHSLG